jgi:very-short-patch-repair endonuclease
MRQNPTFAEAQLWQLFLKNHRPRFYRQRPIGNYIADFYCAKARLVIELDGDAHTAADKKAYDQWRSEVLNGFGISVIRFSNDEVMHAFEAVCASIAEKVAATKHPP